MTTYAQKVNDLSNSLTRLESRLINNIFPLRENMSNPNWADMYQLVEQSDWAGLHNTSHANLLTLEAKIISLEAEQAEVNTVLMKMETVKADFFTNTTNATIKSSFDNVIQEVKNGNLTIDQKEEAEKRLLNASTSSVKAFNVFVGEVEKIAYILDHFYEATLSKIAYNYFCYLTAELNLNPTTNLYTGNPTNMFYYYRNKVEDKIEALKNSISTNDPSTISDATATQNYLKSKIENNFLASLKHLLNGSTPSYTDKRTIARVSTGLTHTLAAYFATRWMKWNYNWHPLCDLHSQLVSKAQARSISRINFTGKKRSINTILSQMNTYEGQDVIVEGTFGDFGITTLGPNKAVSTGTLEHATSGQKIGVLIPYFRLDSTGLYNGAYCQLAGTFHKQHPENNNQPTVVIDRLSLSSLSKTNFWAWLLLEIRYLFEQVPHNFALHYSFEKGKTAMANRIKYDVVAANNKELKKTKLF